MSPEEKEVLNLLYISPYNSKGTEGWIVKFRIYPDDLEIRRRENSKNISKLFTASVYGDHNKALEAARAYRDSWLQENRRLLSVGRNGGGEYSVYLQKHNTSGIVAMSRTMQKERSGRITYWWQTGFRDASGKRKTKRFSISRYGEIGALVKAIHARVSALREIVERDPSVPELLEYYEGILSSLDEEGSLNQGRSIAAITTDDEITPTSKFHEIKMRVGQKNSEKQF